MEGWKVGATPSECTCPVDPSSPIHVSVHLSFYHSLGTLVTFAGLCKWSENGRVTWSDPHLKDAESDLQGSKKA